MLKEKEERLIALYRSGLGVLPSARIVGCGNSEALAVLHKAGIIRQAKNDLGRVKEQEVCELSKQGFSMPKIVEMTGLSFGRVRGILKAYNVDTSKKRSISQETQDRMVQLYEAKKTGGEIAEELGVLPSAVYRELRRAGVEGRKITGPRSRFVHYITAAGMVVRFRSNWEVVFARYLDEQGLKWAYESHTWLLPDGSVYTPDFWVPSLDVYFEVKGLLTEDGATKIALFRSAYPHIDLQLVDRDYFNNHHIDIPEYGEISKLCRFEDDAEMTNLLPN